MTGVDTLLICIVVCLIAYFFEKNIYNPVFIMAGLWAVIMFFANQRLYGMFGASTLTYSLIGIGIACFGIGALINRARVYVLGKRGVQRLATYSQCREENEINYPMLRILCVISVAVMIYPAYQSFRQMVVAGITMNDIRMDNSVTYSNALLKMISNYIARPFSFAIIPIFANEIIGSKKRDWIVIVCGALAVIERVFMDGGRMIILTVIINLFVALKMEKSNSAKKKTRIVRKEKKRQMILVIIASIAAIIGIYQVSLSRGIDAEDFVFSLYSYLCGCIPNLSIRLEQAMQHGQHTFGLASLNGYFAFLFSVFEHLGIGTPDFYKQAQVLMNVESGVQIRAFGSAHFNAFVGPYFYMYLDGGVTGVIMGMIIYGAVSYHFYKMYRMFHRKRDKLMYLLIAQGLINSMVRIQFVNTYYAMAFVYLFLITAKMNGHRRNSNARYVPDTGSE